LINVFELQKWCYIDSVIHPVHPLTILSWQAQDAKHVLALHL